MKERTNAILAGLGSRYALKGGALTLNVVALYDGFMTAVYAHEAVGSLTMALRPRANVASSVWSFDMLHRLDVRHASIRAASEADVIIVAADASCPLPLYAVSWLARSLQESGKGTPLIVALHQEQPTQTDVLSPLLADLEPIARRWNTTVLCNGDFDKFLEQAVPMNLANVERPGLSGIESDNPFPTPHKTGRWGINE